MKIVSKYKIVLNCKTLSSNTNGIGQYIKNLGQSLDKLKKIDSFFFYGSYFSKKFYIPKKKKSLNNIIRDYLPFSYELREFIHGYFFDKGNRKNKIKFYHEPSILPLPFKGLTIITVHDLSWILYPHLHPHKRTKYLTNLFANKIERASSIITDSKFIKNQIVNTFNISETNIHTIALGIDDDYKPRKEDEVLHTLKKFNLHYDKFFLYLGTIEPRKNLIDMIEGYIKLPFKIRSSFPLVIVGGFGWNDRKNNFDLKNYIENNPIYWIKYQSKNIVSDLISSARLLIYPSFYEGFGFPPLEAMKSNTPVLCSNIPTLKEILKDYVIYAENGNIETFTNAMKFISTLEKNKNKSLEKARNYSNTFTWKNCVTKTFNLYHKHFKLYS
mgnify:CR=1 FL=1